MDSSSFLRHYDETKTFLKSQHQIPAIGADGEQAYARLYEADRLMLLYPEIPGSDAGVRKEYGMAGGTELLQIATVDISRDETSVRRKLNELCKDLGEQKAA